MGKEDIFRSTIGNKSPHQVSNDNGVRIVNFAIKKFSVKSRCPRTQKFITRPPLLLMDRLKTRLFTCW